MVRKYVLISAVIAGCWLLIAGCCNKGNQSSKNTHKYNGIYEGDNISRIGFPIGGMGAGMFAVEGTGSISEMSIMNHPDVFNEPNAFSALMIKGQKNKAKVLEGPVPTWKLYGFPGSANGMAGKNYGLPRFEKSTFEAKFPFASIKLKDENMPVDVELKAWSPFIPLDAENSSLPVGAFEYTFTNKSPAEIDAVYSFNSNYFIATDDSAKKSIKAMDKGFVLDQECTPTHPEAKAAFAAFTDDANTVVDHCWFRGGWWDPLTMAWKHIEDGTIKANAPKEKDAPGASLYVPFKLKAGESKTIKLMFAWYVPHSTLKTGKTEADMKDELAKKKEKDKKVQKKVVVKKEAKKAVCIPGVSACCAAASKYYEPWYSARFKDVNGVTDYWKLNYESLKKESDLFTTTFYNTTLPDEIKEAVAANLCILKSPTVLIQKDGRIWGWEGCGDWGGCCHGSCTHVWNYAQAICNLFPQLERQLRETEYEVSQDSAGHQTFRTPIPIAKPAHDFHAASDGQLGGIMKVYREWKISGNTEWMKNMYPLVEKSIGYFIKNIDPKGQGVLDEPHHNTYDIEFWGPDVMCSGFYLGALKAASEMGTALGKDVKLYNDLFEKGKKFLETKLYNGEYFYQIVQWEGLKAKSPDKEALAKKGNVEYSEEAVELLKKEGPKYQYGKGCLSDGVLGLWMADLYGVGDIVDNEKVKSHLMSIYKYNLKTDLSEYPNPQRPSYACGKEGGLLLCTWPKGEMPSLPFVYSNEVWTGIEYQVASHLLLEGMTQEGLKIVQLCRDRYDGRVRNPFDEYECGHWYARAMSSYALIQGYTGIRYDAVDKTLYLSSHPGKDYTSFISTATGWGFAGMKGGKPFVDIKKGTVDVKKYVVDGKAI